MTNEEMKMLLKKNGVSDENIEKISAKYVAGGGFFDAVGSFFKNTDGWKSFFIAYLIKYLL